MSEIIGCCEKHEVHFDKDCSICKLKSDLLASQEKLEESDDMLSFYKAELEHRKEELLASQEREMWLRKALEDISNVVFPGVEPYTDISPIERCKLRAKECLADIEGVIGK